MEKLKACSTEDALKWVENEICEYCDDGMLVGPEIKAVEALLCIRNELNRRAEPENKALTYSVEFTEDEITEFRHYLNAVKNNQKLGTDIRMSVFKLLHKLPNTIYARKPEGSEKP